MEENGAVIEDPWILSEFIGEDGLVHGYGRKRKEAFVEAFESQAWLTLHFTAKPNRMPSSEDMDVFEQFENRVYEELEDGGVGALVAVITLEGKRDHLIYFQDQVKFLDAVGPLLTGLSTYKPEITICHDPTWEEWREL